MSEQQLLKPGPAIRRVLVIGVGNAFRGDDSAGLCLARAVAELGPEHIEVYEHDGEGASLMEQWTPEDAVFIFDAVRAGNAPGTVVRLDALREPLPTGFFHYSSHAFGVAEAVEVARSLGRLPRRCVLYGIEGVSFTIGGGLSPAVERALDGLLPDVLREISMVPIEPVHA